MDCTVEELIQKLHELGDENWRKSAKVRVVDGNGSVLDLVDAFDVRFSPTSADIVLDYEENPVLDKICCDTSHDEDDDWEDDDWEDDGLEDAKN